MTIVAPSTRSNYDFKKFSLINDSIKKIIFYFIFYFVCFISSMGKFSIVDGINAV